MKLKLIFILLMLITVLSIILVFSIKNNPSYNLDDYNEIYNEFNQINSMNGNNSQKNEGKEISDLIKNSRGKSYKTIATLKISKIALSCPIIAQYSEENIKMAPARLIGPSPNEIGNFVIVGHNYKNKEMFSNLYKLNKNDEIILKDRKNGEKKYIIYDIIEINGDDFSCVEQNTQQKREVTLITCAPKNRKKRLVIKSIEKI